MKRWRIVTLAWLAVAFFLIGLCGQEPGAGVNLPHPVAFSVRSLNLLVEPSPASLPAAPALLTSIPDQTRARPFELLADHPVLLSERQGRLPSWDTRGPPGRRQRPFSTARLPDRPAVQSHRTVPNPLRKMPSQRGRPPKKGVLQQPLARLVGC
jgi:hypothetical protein